MTDTRPNRLLDAIESPADLKGRSRAELKQIADEVREEVIEVGHLLLEHRRNKVKQAAADAVDVVVGLQRLQFATS